MVIFQFATSVSTVNVDQMVTPQKSGQKRLAHLILLTDGQTAERNEAQFVKFVKSEGSGHGKYCSMAIQGGAPPQL
jgi:hypothetical protein